MSELTEATKLIIREACVREGINLHPNTEFSNIAPGVYQWNEYRPWQAPRRKVAVIKGFDVAIYDN